MLSFVQCSLNAIHIYFPSVNENGHLVSYMCQQIDNRYFIAFHLLR